MEQAPLTLEERLRNLETANSKLEARVQELDTIVRAQTKASQYLLANDNVLLLVGNEQGARLTHHEQVIDELVAHSKDWKLAWLWNQDQAQQQQKALSEEKPHPKKKGTLWKKKPTAVWLEQT